MGGTHEFLADARNEDVLVYVNGELFPRHEAKISVFDSGFLLGDGVWESFRLHNGKLAFVDQHLDRLRAKHESIVMEGAGSCAEVNLRPRDFVNFRIAHACGAPVIGPRGKHARNRSTASSPDRSVASTVLTR